MWATLGLPICLTDGRMGGYHCLSQEGSGGENRVLHSPFHPAHMAWDRPSLVSAWSLCAGHWVQKGQSKGRQYGQVSVPLPCPHFPKLWFWVPEPGSLRLRFSTQLCLMGICGKNPKASLTTGILGLGSSNSVWGAEPA